MEEDITSHSDTLLSLCRDESILHTDTQVQKFEDISTSPTLHLPHPIGLQNPENPLPFYLLTLLSNTTLPLQQGIWTVSLPAV